jgi:rRNA processing protein Krr1/Pno1
VDPNTPVVVKAPKVKVPKEPKAKKAKSSEVKTVETVVLSEGTNHKTVSHPTGKPVTYVRSKDIVQAAGKGFEDVAQDDELEIEDIVVDEFVPNENDIAELEA